MAPKGQQESSDPVIMKMISILFELMAKKEKLINEENKLFDKFESVLAQRFPKQFWELENMEDEEEETAEIIEIPKKFKKQ